MTTLFVTSSGTDIGKTYFCCQLIERLGLRIRCLKPIVTGFDPSAPGSSDTARLLEAMNADVTPENIAATSPWRFREAISADMAAAHESRSLSLDELVEFSSRATNAELNLIEGIGGVMAPIDDRHTVLDWIAALDARVVLVVGSYLGSLSHTLTALAVLRRRHRKPLAIIVSQSLSEPVATEETAAALMRHVGGLPVAIMRRDDPGSAATTVNLIGQLLECG